MTASLPSNELAALLVRSARFRSAPAAMRAQSIEAGCAERLAAGQRIFKCGDSDDSLYCEFDGLETINQVLKRLETQGALKPGYAEIEITDMHKLDALAELNPVAD
ncbi:hypothetical protein RI103_19515 [Paraburkholderia sp. FT54]|uniref:hypothetical protein n=1 Tax=Paraburkholderia sp. FT54 TaxID=3074437 RepID=UPI00287749CB|nr:hypothetical protein [Paraburkholderia sp. FT54]WNC93033.1 hypothetical protein RI103_19515 [Paraburkholderia sp. FT54]